MHAYLPFITAMLDLMALAHEEIENLAHAEKRDNQGLDSKEARCRFDKAAKLIRLTFDREYEKMLVDQWNWRRAITDKRIEDAREEIGNRYGFDQYQIDTFLLHIFNTPAL